MIPPNALKGRDKIIVTIYSYSMQVHMGKKEKLLDKARNNPNALSFEDFVTLLRHCGWVKDHQRGSHVVWYSPKGYRISIQNKNGEAKGYQVKQFFKQFDEEQANG